MPVRVSYSSAPGPPHSKQGSGCVRGAIALAIVLPLALLASGAVSSPGRPSRGPRGPAVPLPKGGAQPGAAVVRRAQPLQTPPAGAPAPVSAAPVGSRVALPSAARPATAPPPPPGRPSPPTASRPATVPGVLAGVYETDCNKVPVEPPVVAQFCSHWLGGGFWVSLAWEDAAGWANRAAQRGIAIMPRSKWARSAHAQRLADRDSNPATPAANATAATDATNATRKGQGRRMRPVAELMPEEEIGRRKRAWSSITKHDCAVFPGHPIVDVMTELLASPQDHVLVDVGANIGHYSLFGLSLGRTVYAFEPIRTLVSKQCESAHLTRRTKGLSNISFHLHRVAVGSKTMKQINVSRPVSYLGDFDSSSAVAENVGHVKAEHKVVERVPLVKLDDVLPADLHVGVLKVDVQGLEALVLAGAAQTLARTRFLVWERREGMMQSTGHRSTKVIKWLQIKHGFNCTGCGGGLNAGDWCCLRSGLQRAPLPHSVAAKDEVAMAAAQEAHRRAAALREAKARAKAAALASNATPASGSPPSFAGPGQSAPPPAVPSR
eukprot:TRINITY_DN16395_c0_g1_i2.p1 TRINITY_DN16395_c0_g1~~TRINITY_DN16395_c0_g1_i2.p1  ORF type:complete len:576 (+),score=77.31 TRINITY_DN16395_c0_g1_i2:79-1728(+)